MKKVLIFPGAFNPFHFGHVFVIKKAIQEINNFDEIWILPSGKRSDKVISISYQDRRAMGALFVQYLKSVITIPVILRTDDLDHNEENYNHEVFYKIISQPDIEFTQLIGSDTYLLIKNKLTIDMFLKEKFLVIERTGFEVPEDQVEHSNTIYLPEVLKGISSTKIRSMVKNGNLEYEKLTIQDIVLYIKKHGLYS